MPGSIRVSVLEAVDLPAAVTGKYVIIRVALGRLEFKTQPKDLDAGKTAPWNSNFTFPVTNLRDKLAVAVCNVDDEAVTQIDIEIPSIVERGYRDEFMDFKGGGRIHLILSFALTDEERRKIQIMRTAALKKRREQEQLKKTVVFQAVQPRSPLDDSAAAAVPRATITEIDEPTKDEQENGSEQNTQAPVGLGPMSKPLNPRFGFDYAKAFGVRPLNIMRKPGEPTNVGMPTVVKKMVKQDSNEKVLKESTDQDMGTLNLSHRGSDNLPRSRSSSLCTDSGDVSLATPAMDNSAITKSEASQDGASRCDNLSSSLRPTPPSPSTPSQMGLLTSTLPQSMQGRYAEKITRGKFQAQTIESTILHQDPEEKSRATASLQEEVWQVENQRINDMLEAEAAAMAVGINKKLLMEDEQREMKRINKAFRSSALKEQIRSHDLQIQKEQGPHRPGVGAKMEQLEVISEESSLVSRMVKVHLEMGNLESRPVVVRLEPEEYPVIRSSSVAMPSGPVSISEFEHMANSEIRKRARERLNAERAFSNKVWQVVGAIADEILCTPGKVQRSGLLLGPEARWAHKRSIKSRWASPLASPEKPGSVGTENPSYQTPDLSRSRVRLLQLFPPIAGQEEAAGEGQSFHEHEGLAGTIASVIHKVIGGAAVLLAALFTVVTN